MNETSPEETELSVVWIEEEEGAARSVASYLATHSVHVRILPDITQALAAMSRRPADVVLIDLASGRGSLETCTTLRKRTDVPIIVVTPSQEETDRVLGLEAGADDWLSKPFSPRELLARIRVRARRARGEFGPRAMRVGRLTIDRSTMTATLDTQPLTLTTYEFMLLYTLAERAGSVVSREHVVGRVRGDTTEAFERSVDIHISHLRAKLGDDPKRPRFIRTVRGVGYMLASEQTT